jgi:hypothetical protein
MWKRKKVSECDAQANRHDKAKWHRHEDTEWTRWPRDERWCHVQGDQDDGAKWRQEQWTQGNKVWQHGRRKVERGSEWNIRV